MGNDLVIIRRKHGRIWKFRKEKVNWRGKREKESSSCSSLTNPLFIPPSLSWRFQKYLLAITPGVFKGQSRKEEQEEERGIRVHNVDKIYCHATRLRDSGPRNTSNAPLTRKKLSWQFFTFFRVMHSYCISNSIESRIPIFVASFSSTFFFYTLFFLFTLQYDSSISWNVIWREEVIYLFFVRNRVNIKSNRSIESSWMIAKLNWIFL